MGILDSSITIQLTDGINASNPCSEYMFLDDSSCNLASHRLTKYRREDGSFDVKSFVRATQITARAQDMLYDFSSFPEKEIALQISEQS